MLRSAGLDAKLTGGRLTLHSSVFKLIALTFTALMMFVLTMAAVVPQAAAQDEAVDQGVVEEAAPEEQVAPEPADPAVDAIEPDVDPNLVPEGPEGLVDPNAVPEENLRMAPEMLMGPMAAAANQRVISINKAVAFDAMRRLQNGRSYWSPIIEIPSAEMTNGVLDIPAGTVLRITNTMDPLIATGGTQIWFTGADGSTKTANVTYTSVGTNTFEVVLPKMQVGGNGRLTIRGVGLTHNTLARLQHVKTTLTFPAQDPTPVCTNPVGEQVEQPRQPARNLTPEEYKYGSPVYVAMGLPTDLMLQTDQSASFVKVASSQWVYNALAFNPEDNWLYAVSQSSGGYHPCYPPGNMLQINPATGQVFNLGKITVEGTPNSPFAPNADDLNVINSGVFTSEGYFVANTSLSGSGKLYKLDIAQAPGLFPAYPIGSEVFRGEVSHSEDWAVHPDDKRFMWGVQSFSAAEGKIILERIDTRDGSITLFDISNLETADGRPIASGGAQSWGKAWTYGNGDLGFGTGSSGATTLGFELRVENPTSASPTFTLVNVLDNLPSSYNSDGASNIAPPPPHLQTNLAISKVRTETKKDSQGILRTYWAVTVKNTGDAPSSGGVFQEYLPKATHHGFNGTGPTARFERFGPDSSRVNGQMPGTDQIGDGKGIYAGMYPQIVDGQETFVMTGFVGTLPSKAKVSYIISAPVRTDQFGNLKATCSLNRVSLQSNDAELSPGQEDNVATDACVDKVKVDTEPQPTGTPNEYTATYDVVVIHPEVTADDIANDINFNTNEVLYGALQDTPQFTDAAAISDASVVFTDEFGKSLPPKAFSGSGPYDLNTFDNLKTIKPEGQDGSNGQHVYQVTIKFTLDYSKVNAKAAPPEGYTGQETGNEKCYVVDGLNPPNFGLTNDVSLGGWKDTDCIPLTPPETMSVFLEKVAFDPDAPKEISPQDLLAGATFAVYRGDPDDRLQFNQDGSVNTTLNPEVTADVTAVDGRVELKDLEAPGIYFVIETKAPNVDGMQYSLLPEPVKFETAWSEDGAAVIKVLSGEALAVSGNQCDLTGISECNSKVGILQVADVTQGNLPRTGGLGVLPLLLGSVTLFGVAAGVRRKLVV